mgnify:CR=1 FL=1
MGSKVISAIVAEFLNPISDGTKGRMLTDWQFINGKWYYFNENETGDIPFGAASDGTKGASMTNVWIGEYYVNTEGVWEEDKKQ